MLWSSIISRSRDFIDSIVTRSLTQPPRDAHIIFDHTAGYHKECFLGFTSSTCPRSTDQVSILSIPEYMEQYVRGLICCWSDVPNGAAIYNPTTRHTINLPEPKSLETASCFLGYDPLENRYEVLFIPLKSMEKACQVFTLGDPTVKQWRIIQGVGAHLPLANVVCINGVIIYYRALNTEYDSTCKYRLMSFDVRSEKFYYVEAPKTLMDDLSTMVNYQGELGVVCCEIGMEIWVMENATKRWSRIFFYEMDGFKTYRVQGATRGGEIVFVKDYYYIYDSMLHVLYYDPKRNCMR